MSWRLLLGEVRHRLEEAGFWLSDDPYTEEACFDLAARRGSKLLFIKVSPNVSDLSREAIKEVDLVAATLGGVPLIVGQSIAKKAMEDDVAYRRYWVFAVTPRTLSGIVEGRMPIAEGGVGGITVELDYEAVRRGMRRLGFSRGELASMAGISKKALYSYERGLAKCTLSIALRLQRILGVPIIRYLDLLSRRVHSRPRVELRLEGLAGRVTEKLLSLGFGVVPLKLAPFEAIATWREERLLVGILEPGLAKKKTAFIRSVANVVRVRPILVAGGPCEGALTLEELEGIDQAEGLLSLCPSL